MALGCRFYLAIAKIRAARKLWADVIEACGGSADVQRMRLRVSTGRRVLTTRNQLLNILRNTVACYAGAVADADIITTTPFDAPTGLPTEASRHNARNTQHILAEECYLAQVVDPAGSSGTSSGIATKPPHHWPCVGRFPRSAGPGVQSERRKPPPLMQTVRNFRTTKIGYSDFGPGDGSAFAMRCPRCRAFPHCRAPSIRSPPLVANAEFSPQPREVVGAHRILGTLLR